MIKKFIMINILAFLVVLTCAASESVNTRTEALLTANATLPRSNKPREDSVQIPMPMASGTAVKKNTDAEIDYSNTKDGYIMVRYLGITDKKLRVIVKCPNGVSYTYHLNANKSYEVFPLSEGNGSYQAGVYINVKGTKYSAVLSATFQVTLTNEFTPFLRPNQYVNYNSGNKTVEKSAEVVKDSTGILSSISAIYSYVTGNITYDKELAKTVQSGYLSDVDAVLRKGKGICFDYAAVMTAMLRSQQIPTKLVIGYSGKVYHAWINVYSSETGWIDKAIYFDGKSWKLMDPTFAAAKTDGNIKEASYTAKLLY